MYKVTKRQPNRVISEEYYANKLHAMLRRDMINATCKGNEYVGATMEAIAVPDLITTNAFEVKIQGLTTAHYQLEGLEIAINADMNHFINFDAENEGNCSQGESEWFCHSFSFHDYETETDYENVKMGSDTLAELNGMISHSQQEDVTAHAYEEWLERA